MLFFSQCIDQVDQCNQYYLLDKWYHGDKCNPLEFNIFE